MEGYKALCYCVLQLDNDRGAFALRSIVLNVSQFDKIKRQFIIVYVYYFDDKFTFSISQQQFMSSRRVALS